MVASSSAAKSNTVIRDEEAIGKSKVGSEPTAEQKAAEAARLAGAKDQPPPKEEPQPPQVEAEPPQAAMESLALPSSEEPSETVEEAQALTARVMEAALDSEVPKEE